jgi:hypothetical protein
VFVVFVELSKGIIILLILPSLPETYPESFAEPVQNRDAGFEKT